VIAYGCADHSGGLGADMSELLFGITLSNVVHTDADVFDVDTRFRMVKEAGVFDYVDKTPPVGELEIYQKASAKYGLPVLAGGWYYTRGRDEPLLQWHLQVARELGSRVQNVQFKTLDASGKPVTDEEVAETYLWAAELGDRIGVVPCFEVHCNMWSEHFGRVARVGERVEQRGAKFNITLDHSHVIFKIDNPREQEVQGLRADIEAGLVELDPFRPHDVCSQWIERNWIRHAHARASVPANPVNVWARLPDGRFGRGIQYPFVRPRPGEWHADWDEAKLEPWKEVLRRLLQFHARRPDSCLGQISTEFIPFPDYGGGAKYSMFENAVACVTWLQQSWKEIQAAASKDSAARL